MQASDTQPDQELVEYLKGKWHDERPVLSHFHTTKAYEIALCKFILRALSNWQGKDGSRVVRTDPDQTLPHLECNDFSTRKAQTDMVKAGWVKILPLIGKDGE